MEDFGFDLQNMKDKYATKIVLKAVLLLLAFAIIILILIVSVKSRDTKDIASNEEIANIALIKSGVKEIKKTPSDEGGIVIDNLDVSVYDIIDNTDNNDKNPVIQKTEQNIDLSKSDTKIDEYFLDSKIDGIDDADEKPILKIENYENNTTNNSNITVNNKTKPQTKQEIKAESLSQLGNSALIKNLNKSKDVKPGIKVQVLALANRDSLVQYWEDIKNKYESLIADKTYYIERVDINGSAIYRLQIGNFFDNESAESFCKKYIELTNKSRIDCIVIKQNN